MGLIKGDEYMKNKVEIYVDFSRHSAFDCAVWACVVNFGQGEVKTLGGRTANIQSEIISVLSNALGMVSVSSDIILYTYDKHIKYSFDHPTSKTTMFNWLHTSPHHIEVQIINRPSGKNKYKQLCEGIIKEQINLVYEEVRSKMGLT